MVEELKEITPDDEEMDSPKGNESVKGEDPFKAVGDGVNGPNDAANKADEAKAATDKVKNLLPF